MYQFWKTKCYIVAMKNFLLPILIVWFASCNAQTTITPEQAKDNVGKSVTVCGKVFSEVTSKNGNIFLNFGASYPNEVFSVFISSKYAAPFKESYSQKNVCIVGMVKLYKSKPEIEVEAVSQITVK